MNCSQKTYHFFVWITIFLIGSMLFSILNGCASSSTGWKKVQAMNTLEAYQEFLDSNPSDTYAEQARGKIDTLSFLRAKDKHSIPAYEQYVRQFPGGKFVNEANQRLEKLYFYQRAELENTLEGYDEFLFRFPNGAFTGEAKARREQLFFNQQISNENTIASYESYLKEYPDGVFSDSAQLRIERLKFEAVKAIDTDTMYLDYLKRYPDGAYKAEALARIELCAFRAANKERTIDAYEKYVRMYPQGTYTAIAYHNIATQSEAYREAKVVRVVVDQLFYQKLTDGPKDALTGISLPIESLTRRLLSDHAGMTAVGPDTKSYAATLSIETEGLALGKNYGTDTLHFTGASLSGTLSLTLLGYPPFKRSFYATEEPASTRVNNSINGTSAPFAKVFKAPGSFIPKLLEVMYKVYGPSALVSAIRDADETVRCAAMDVSGAFNVSNAFTVIVTALRDNNFQVRQRAALALGRYKDDRAIEPLVKNLQEVLDFSWIKEESNKARAKAAVALGMIGSPKVIKPLITALKDPNPDVRFEVIVSLRNITKMNFGEDYDAWMKWFEEEGRK